MELYLAGICVGQTNQLLFTHTHTHTHTHTQEMNLYLAGEHSIKNGQLRQTGGGGTTFACWNRFIMQAQTNTFLCYTIRGWICLLIVARLLL